MAVIIDKDSGGGGGGSAVLGFILGAVLLAVAVVGFFMWDNYKSGGAPKAIVVTGQSKESTRRPVCRRFFSCAADRGVRGHFTGAFMGDTIIITEDEPKPAPQVVVA